MAAAGFGARNVRAPQPASLVSRAAAVAAADSFLNALDDDEPGYTDPAHSVLTSPIVRPPSPLASTLLASQGAGGSAGGGGLVSPVAVISPSVHYSRDNAAHAAAAPHRSGMLPSGSPAALTQTGSTAPAPGTKRPRFALSSSAPPTTEVTTISAPNPVGIGLGSHNGAFHDGSGGDKMVLAAPKRRRWDADATTATMPLEPASAAPFAGAPPSHSTLQAPAPATALAAAIHKLATASTPGATAARPSYYIPGVRY
ncbi:hypothetical protein EON62_04980 [archaeon]|nr:MAG: hypothetical protein EON62_04980 [archaeon]